MRVVPPALRLMKGEEGAGGAASEESENEPGDELPFQRRVHGSKTLLMAESAIAYWSRKGDSSLSPSS